MKQILEIIEEKCAVHKQFPQENQSQKRNLVDSQFLEKNPLLKSHGPKL